VQAFVEAELAKNDAPLLDWLLVLEGKQRAVRGFFVDVASLPQQDVLRAAVRAKFLAHYAALSPGLQEAAHQRLHEAHLDRELSLSPPAWPAIRESIEREEQSTLAALPRPSEVIAAHWPRLTRLFEEYAALASELSRMDDDNENDELHDDELPAWQTRLVAIAPALEGEGFSPPRDEWRTMTPCFLGLSCSVGVLLEPGLAAAHRFPLVLHTHAPGALHAVAWAPKCFEALADEPEWLLEALRGVASPPAVAASTLAVIARLDGEVAGAWHKADNPTLDDGELAALQEHFRALGWPWGEHCISARRISARAHRQRTAAYFGA
jgi:hypothetical protein